MSKTEFSILPGHIKNEIMQDVIDLLNYNPKVSKKILNIVKTSNKPYVMQEMIVNGERTGRMVRTVKLNDEQN